MFQFYGANRTGCFSGRLIQLQNLTKNYISDINEAREIVKSGDFEIMSMLYDNIPDILSQLIRTAFVPRKGYKFIVADFAAIEARVIAWLAGEQWRMDLFEKGGDIYCQSASQMFGVPVEKNGVNGHLRQKGKIAELACIAEGELVLTDKGLVPIENISLTHKLWDGENWVSHEGIICKGEREVIEYDGLRATKDHLVWVEGKSEPIQFGIAAACGTHLIQTGNGGRAVRMGENYFTGKKMEQNYEPMLCFDKVRRLWKCAMANSRKSYKRKIKRLSAMFTAKTNPLMAGQEINSSKTTLRKSKRQRLSQLWSPRNKIQLCECFGSEFVFDTQVRTSTEDIGNRPYRQRWKLRKRKYKICNAYQKQPKQKRHGFKQIFTNLLALFLYCGDKEVVARFDKTGDNSRRRNSGIREEKELETNSGKVRVYDIRNAGRNHRFTVSGKLVHNCGYNGSVGALKAMGAVDMGIPEEELKPIVDAWRKANPNIVKLWYRVDEAVKKAVKNKVSSEVRGVGFSCKSGMLFITLPSGRNLVYVKPRMGTNRFGGESVTYEGIGAAKKWERIESYGGKFVENIVQAISRDILMYAMQTLRYCFICGHVHDELIIECDKRVSLEAICEQMGRTPPWAEGLLLRADGFECEFYRKD